GRSLLGRRPRAAERVRRRGARPHPAPRRPARRRRPRPRRRRALGPAGHGRRPRLLRPRGRRQAPRSGRVRQGAALPALTPTAPARGWSSGTPLLPLRRPLRSAWWRGRPRPGASSERRLMTSSDAPAAPVQHGMTPIEIPAQPDAIELGTGPLPEASSPESWHSEYGSMFARNVGVATLTPFLPDPATATGTAV